MQSGADDLDDVDRLLITALQKDGRLGYAELGELVGLSAGGARKRVMRLQDRGVMQIVGVTDPLMLGYQSMALVGVAVDGDSALVADRLQLIDDVIYIVLSAGRYDLLVEVIARDPEALLRVVNEGVRSVDGVRAAEIFPYFAIHTHRFGWGVGGGS